MFMSFVRKVEVCLDGVIDNLRIFTKELKRLLQSNNISIVITDFSETIIINNNSIL